MPDAFALRVDYNHALPVGSRAERGDRAVAPLLVDVDLFAELAQCAGCKLRALVALELTAEGVKLWSLRVRVGSLEAEELQA